MSPEDRRTAVGLVALGVVAVAAFAYLVWDALSYAYLSAPLRGVLP